MAFYLLCFVWCNVCYRDCGRNRHDTDLRLCEMLYSSGKVVILESGVLCFERVDRIKKSGGICWSSNLKKKILANVYKRR